MNTSISQKSFANLLKVQDLRMIIALSKQRTILRAAEAMQLSQPAITKRLQDLEKDLGIALFHRMSRGVEPTPYGEILIKHAHIILNQIRHAEGEVSDLSDGEGGRLSIGVPVSAACELVADSISKLLEVRRNVQVTLVEDYNIRLVPALKRGDIDVIAGRLPSVGQEDIDFEHLYDEPLVVVVRKEHPLANKKKIKKSELLEHKWMLPLRDSIMYMEIEDYFKREDLPMPRTSIFSLSHVGSLKLIRATDLIGIYPYESVRERIEGGTLIQLNTDLSPEPSKIGYTVRQQGFMSPAAEAFIEIFRELGKAKGKSKGK